MFRLPPSRFTTRLRKMSRGWGLGRDPKRNSYAGTARFLKALLLESDGCLWAPTTRA